MGKIIQFQDRINNKAVPKKSKPELDTKGIKNFYNKLHLAYKPGIENEYNLTSSQKTFARNVRKGTLVTGIAITALASSLSIGAAISNHISRATIQEIAYQNTILDKETVLNDAKLALTNIILPNGSTYDGSFITFPSKDEFDNINSIQVNEQIKLNSSCVYRYISGHKDNKNNPEIVNKFLDTLIAIQNASNSSQNDLVKLQDLTDKINEMNLSLDGNNIIDLTQKDIDIER